MSWPRDSYIPALRTFNDPILSQVCREITNDVAALAIARQLEQCVKRYNGLGLAAPQIGLAVQAIIVKPNSRKPGLVMINPKVLGYSGRLVNAQEGCLSYPKVYTYIDRPIQVSVEFKTIVWNAHTAKPGVCKVGDAWRAAGGAGAVSGVDRHGGGGGA